MEEIPSYGAPKRGEIPFNYDAIADNYAAVVDTRPWNALYERPGTMALLPEVRGLRVLDVGCGSGWYAEMLVSRGAEVVAVDITARMVELTRARLRGTASVLQWDIGQPLTFAETGGFDLIVAPLVVHYLRDWGPMLGELNRILADGGRLLFSTHHPSYDPERIIAGGYFRRELIEEEWRGIGTVRFYHRPLTAITEALAGAGFVIERMVEPAAAEELRQAAPAVHAHLETRPAFLVIRARKG